MTKNRRPDNPLSADETLKLTIEKPARIRSGATGRGFNPYGGLLAQKPVSRKKDLRKLGEWLETKRKAEALKQEETMASGAGRESQKK